MKNTKPLKFGFRDLEKTSKKDLQFLLKFSKKEIKEWENFIKVILELLNLKQKGE